MTPLVRRVYDHYRECLAVNWQVPEASDPIVRFHAGLLRQVEDAVGRTADARRLAQLLTRGRE